MVIRTAFLDPRRCLVLVASLLLIACSSDTGPEQPVYLSGRLLDAETGQATPGVVRVYERGTLRLIESVEARDGSFRIAEPGVQDTIIIQARLMSGNTPASYVRTIRVDARTPGPLTLDIALAPYRGLDQAGITPDQFALFMDQFHAFFGFRIDTASINGVYIVRTNPLQTAGGLSRGVISTAEMERLRFHWTDRNGIPALLGGFVPTVVFGQDGEALPIEIETDPSGPFISAADGWVVIVRDTTRGEAFCCIGTVTRPGLGPRTGGGYHIGTISLALQPRFDQVVVHEAGHMVFDAGHPTALPPGGTIMSAPLLLTQPTVADVKAAALVRNPLFYLEEKADVLGLAFLRP